jgi:hypothetical protein
MIYLEKEKKFPIFLQFFGKIIQASLTNFIFLIAVIGW